MQTEKKMNTLQFFTIDFSKNFEKAGDSYHLHGRTVGDSWRKSLAVSIVSKSSSLVRLNWKRQARRSHELQKLYEKYSGDAHTL